ncbi:phage terminase small subunit [Pseudomonas mendocina]|uniref:phage terminase small subunit n=1 Tax=Ectopseudomonas mendocina TaxID=300 RepID=UPI0023DC39B6|nr:phage terminase small subunit [Pseudomonas mendocina]MDF2073201.1 phage terminase small subunit [Pseudomonas mendocina]
MGLSLAQRTQQRKRAAAAAAATPQNQTMAGSGAYELQMAQLHQHYQQLKGIQSTQAKEELKAKLLPDYAPYIAGVLASGQGAQDEVVTTIMLWRFDAGDYQGGLDIAAYVLEHGLTMPDRFARTTGCLVAEEIAEAALKALKAGGTFEISVLAEAERLTAGQDMPDEVRAKLMLAMGRVTAAQVGPDKPNPADVHSLEVARHFLTRALELHDKCGGKRDLELVDRQLKKHAEQKPS